MAGIAAAADLVANCPVETIRTVLSRARCRQPALVERMKDSLSTHGQLTPLVAARTPEGIQLIDGFKRLTAARVLEWTTLLVTFRTLDETAQWATMLLLNRGARSMTELEEAMVLRELTRLGLHQTEIASLLHLNKSWVCRRMGLVERLHPELIESMKIGLLHPGVARRLLALPPGNQLELAAAVQKAMLGARDTELLVSLWSNTKDAKGRQTILADPRAALREHHPQTQRPPSDPRLSVTGQRLQRMLQILHGVVPQTLVILEASPSSKDLRILRRDLRTVARSVDRLAIVLGSIASARSSPNGDASAEIAESAAS